MSGYYPYNPHGPQNPSYYPVDPNNVPPMLPQDGHVPHGIPEAQYAHGLPPESHMQHGLHYMQPLSSEHLGQAYLDHYEEDPRGIPGAQNAQARVRRRAVPGTEHVKHRRTRSGCYTCRNRRVKCDETRPTCDRCRKGNRDCIWPEPQSNTKSGRGSAKSGSKSSPQESGSSPEEQEDEQDAKQTLASIPDDDEDEDDDMTGSTDFSHIASQSANQPGREASNTPSLTQDRSPSPSTGTEASTTITHPTPRPPLSRSASQQTVAKSPSAKPPLDLPQDVKFYLNYHRHQMSSHHYSLKSDGSNFIKTTFLDVAVKNEPLLYAVVGFAAYFHSLTKPNARIQDFLKYYNKSVSLLRQSIIKSKKQNIATLMTILQLASIEEVLGDWVNLMGHQKAAYEILTRLYTPQTILKTPMLRKVLLWYIRFDLFVGFQSGTEAFLGKEWYQAMHEWYAREVLVHPDDLSLRYEERFAYSRLVAMSMNTLFAKKSKGQISDEMFTAQVAEVDRQMAGLESGLHPSLLDPNQYVSDFTGAPPRDPESIVDPYEPRLIWGGDLWTTNYLMLDMWGFQMFYQIQLSISQRKPLPPDMIARAYRCAAVFEAIEKYPKAPPGAILTAQASLGIATIFLPKDQKHVRWCQRKLALIEASGYIYPTAFRTRMAQAWGADVTDWWLPNDEGCPPIIRSIKDFIVERTQAPKDQTSKDLHEMKGMFNNLTISDSPSPDKAGETAMEGGQEFVLEDVPTSLDETLAFTGGSPEFAWSDDYSNQDAYPGRS